MTTTELDLTPDACPQKPLSVTAAVEVARDCKERGERLAISVHKNPCHVEGSSRVDELPWIVMFTIADNPLTSPWGYVDSQEKAKAIRHIAWGVFNEA